MPQRLQRTIRHLAEACGTGFFTGTEVTLRFLPAPVDSGIVFERMDIPGARPIPATIEHAIQQPRRTAIALEGVAVEMVEHLMAAFYGLQIDNCRVQLNGPEVPGFDGSSRELVDCLLAAGTVLQDRFRPELKVREVTQACDESGDAEVAARPMVREGLAITYQLDYGPRSVIPPQNLTVHVTREYFINELAAARTFVLESEVRTLRSLGYGLKTTARDLLVFGPGGVIDNALHWPDECARHKILDCIGDFALGGCDLHGHFTAYRSGHSLNRQMIERLKMSPSAVAPASRRKAA